MSEIKKVVFSFMQQQQAQLKQQQDFFILQQQALTAQLSKASASSSIISQKEMKMESLADSIAEFIYDPDNGLTFEAWFVRYEDLFKVDAKDLDDDAKVRLILRKLNTVSYKQYIKYSSART